MVKNLDGPTREQVIQLARDAGAGFACETLLADGRDADDILSRLAAIAYAAGQDAEREACAKIADIGQFSMGRVAAAIRARGNK